MIMPLLIAAWVISAATMLVLLWRIMQFGPAAHASRGLLVPLGVLAVLLARSGWLYHAGQPGRALVTAAAPIAIVGGGYGLIVLVSVLGKARWN